MLKIENAVSPLEKFKQELVTRVTELLRNQMRCKAQVGSCGYAQTGVAWKDCPQRVEPQWRVQGCFQVSCPKQRGSWAAHLDWRGIHSHNSRALQACVRPEGGVSAERLAPGLLLSVLGFPGMSGAVQNFQSDAEGASEALPCLALLGF